MSRSKILPLITGFVFCLYASTVVGQSSEEKAVTDVVKQLFKGMENGDSSMVSKVFAKQVTTVSVRDGSAKVDRGTTIAPFLKAIGTSHAEKWYEEFWNLKVSVDGKFAQIWCDYAFYLGNKFSHCGVDAFQLIKEDQGWKIIHLADTRRSTGCDIPEAIQNKHK